MLKEAFVDNPNAPRNKGKGKKRKLEETNITIEEEFDVATELPSFPERTDDEPCGTTEEENESESEGVDLGPSQRSCISIGSADTLPLGEPDRNSPNIPTAKEFEHLARLKIQGREQAKSYQL